jgi:signal transduction histidine kinase
MSPKDPGAAYILRPAAAGWLIASYLVLFALGYALKPWPTASAALWPAYAVPVVACLLLPYRWWPAVALVSMLGEFVELPLLTRFIAGRHAGLLAEFGLASANILTSMVPVALARALGIGHPSDRLFPRPSPLWLVAFPLGVVPGATLGGWVHAQLAHTSLAAEPVMIWAASSVLGMLTFGPLAYRLIEPSRPPAPTRAGLPERITVVLMTLGLSAWLIAVPWPWTVRYPPHFLFGIPLIWLALRFGRVAVASGVAIAALTVCIGSAQGLGAFAGVTTPVAWSELLFPTQLFLIILCGGTHLINLLTLRQRALVEELGGTNERLREYAQELDRAEDNARRAAAADLHDGIGQLLAGQAMLLGALRPMVSGDQAQAFLHDALAASQEAQTGIRTMIQDLSPPELEEASVGGVLQGLARLFESRYRFRVRVQVSGAGGVGDERLRIIYRVVRELLFNAYKHSRSDRAEVIVDQFADYVDIAVVDSGVGFDPAAPRRRSYGLRHLTERLATVGGTIELDTAPGAGCRANVRVPLASAVQGVVVAAEVDATRRSA